MLQIFLKGRWNGGVPNLFHKPPVDLKGLCAMSWNRCWTRVPNSLADSAVRRKQKQQLKHWILYSHEWGGKTHLLNLLFLTMTTGEQVLLWLTVTTANLANLIAPVSPVWYKTIWCPLQIRKISSTCLQKACIDALEALQPGKSIHMYCIWKSNVLKMLLQITPSAKRHHGLSPFFFFFGERKR